jgi:hypothetical protein
MALRLCGRRAWQLIARMGRNTAAEFHSSSAVLDRPWKNRNSRVVIHQSERGAEKSSIDFDSLGLKYPMTHIPDPETIVKAHYWTPPPEKLPDLPFIVDRTHPGQNLPVYANTIASGTKVVTELRKIKGDITELQNEVEKVVGKSVVLRAGKIIIDGNYKRRLQKWLVGLGF